MSETKEIAPEDRCTRRISDHTGFHWFRCSRRATMEVGGKRYCTQHGKKEQARRERRTAATDPQT